MNGLLRRWAAALLPILQIVILTIVQIVGFIAAAQWNGLASAPSTARAASALSEENSSEEQSAVTTHEESNGEENVASVATPDDQANRTLRGKQLDMFARLIVACLLNSSVLIFWLRTTALAGWRLAAMTFLAFFVCMTVMPQSDAFFSSGIQDH